MKRPQLMALAAALALLAFAAPAHASPKGAFVVGNSTPGTTGGLFDETRDMAVNESGAGAADPGDLYVIDLKNHRIQSLGLDGSFKLAFGWNVVKEGGVGDTLGDGFEICTNAPDCQAGEPGASAEGGRLQSPTGIDVDASDGSVYVWNHGKNRIDKFAADGTWILAFGDNVNQTTSGDVCTAASGNTCKAGAAGSAAGQFSGTFRAQRLAVSPLTGAVFVGDRGNARISEYEPDGDFVRAWGWDVVPGGPAQEFEICDTSCQAGSAEVGFTANTPAQIATGPDGIVYADTVTNTETTLYRFDPSATTAAGLLLPAIETPITLVQTRSSLEVDSGTNRLFVFADAVFELGDLDSTPASLISVHLAGGPGGTQEVEAYARQSTFGTEYLAVGNSVVFLNEAGAPLAIAPSAPTISNLAAHSVDLEATVTPNGPAGIPATGRFQLSEDGGGWKSVGTPVDLGTATSPVAVSQTIAGLEANEHYEARLLVTKPYDNPDVISPSEGFDTPAIAPEVSVPGVQFLAATSAQVVSRINPNNLPTTYHAEYVTEAEFGANGFANATQVPVPEASAGEQGAEKAFLQKLTGLEPATAYRVRFLATNSQGTTEGPDRQFTTRALPDAVFPGRGLEMVTPPEKANRRTKSSEAIEVPGIGIPSPDGESMLLGMLFGVLDGQGDVAFPHVWDWNVLQRGATGWKSDPVADTPAKISGVGGLNGLMATSVDFHVQAWKHKAYLFDSGSPLSTRLSGDEGGPLGKGWYDWLEPNPSLVESSKAGQGDVALIDTTGERMLRWSGSYDYRGLLGPADPSNAQVEGADAIYLQEPPGSGPVHLVNECSGTATAIETQTITMGATGGSFTLSLEGQSTAPITAGASSTTVRNRIDDIVGAGNVAVSKSGSVWTATFPGALAGADVPQLLADSSGLTGGSATAIVATLADGASEGASMVPTRRGDGTIGERACVGGSVTDTRGAVGGGGGILNPGGGVTRTAMSEDGSRVFFTSPDPQIEAGQLVCSAAVSAMTACPAQIFVRQYDSEGNGTVRWISKPEVTGQQATLLGPAGFEGASADGQVVYFKTKTPLTAEDPNGAAAVPGGVKTGTASEDSWDLYRYELPGDRESDPAGGTLTRISGGPGGASDPGVLRDDSSAGALRFLSTDGSKAYFVTRGIIGAPGDAWNQPPSGGTPTPAGTTPSATTRNLYLYDHSKSGDARWRFIAKLPTGGHVANPCASLTARSGTSQSFTTTSTSSGPVTTVTRAPYSCVHGTPDGHTIVFETAAQLVAGDTDAASDIYLYDEKAGELTRITSPPDESSSYSCQEGGDRCNGDLGFAPEGAGGLEHVGLNGGQHQNLAVYGPGAGAAEGAVAVFFETRAPLVLEDQDGARMDVYEWQAGAVSLVSPQNSSSDDAYFSGNSLDGEDVFFETTQRIDPREIDEDADVYDARIGGGFPYTPPRSGCDVLGGACKSPAGPPLVPSPGSTAFKGPGNVVERPKLRCPKVKKAKAKKGKAKASKRGKARCPKPGKKRKGGRR
jgi:hypothetical protein